MHTNLMAVALFIMSAIYPLKWDDAQAMSDERREELLYETVETLLFTDDQKADLYARLAEQLKAVGYLAQHFKQHLHVHFVHDFILGTGRHG